MTYFDFDRTIPYQFIIAGKKSEGKRELQVEMGQILDKG